MTAEEHIAVNQSELNESIKSVETIAEAQNTVNYEEEIAKIEERSPALFNTNASVQEKVKTKLASDIAATQKESGLSPAEKLAQDSVFFCYGLIQAKINLMFTLPGIKFIFRLFHNIFGAS